MPRTDFNDMEWNGIPVQELGHAELLQLCERLHELVWASSENVERVIEINNGLIAVNQKLLNQQMGRLQ